MEQAERMDRLKAAALDAGIGLVLLFLSHLPLIGLVPKLGLLVVIGIQIYLLTTKGQTIGKQYFHLRIVRRDTMDNGGFVTNVLLRGLVNFLLCLVPLYPIVDCLFIFRDDRRCIHDWLANTIVVKG